MGIPNVGKSTLINRMAGRKIAATGDKPGVTKGQQWIKVGTEMELLDTPGILWPKFEDQNVGLRLAAIGSIREEILHPEDIAFFVVRYLLQTYGFSIQERFGIDVKVEDPSDTDEIVKVMEAVGRKRGALMSGAASIWKKRRWSSCAICVPGSWAESPWSGRTALFWKAWINRNKAGKCVNSIHGFFFFAYFEIYESCGNGRRGHRDKV